MSIVVPGMAEETVLRMDGALPPDLEGTFFRIGPADDGDQGGMLHAIELREGKAVSYRRRSSDADANVLWHAGKVLALPESGLPSQYDRELQPEEFGGGLSVAVASHVKRDGLRGRRVVFGVEEGPETTSLRLGEWDADGALVAAQSVRLERATWQHDLAVTAEKIVFIETPTEPLGAGSDGAAVNFRWVPGAEGWVGTVRRADVMAEDAAVEWASIDPCVVTHVMGAHDDVDGGVVLYAVCYPAPEKGQPVDLEVSMVRPEGIGMTAIGGGLGVLERWRVAGGRVERDVVDERWVEYLRVDALCEGGGQFRYGYGVEMGYGAAVDVGGGRSVAQLGLLKVDIADHTVVAWQPGPGLTASEPVFVRAADGRSDDEGWLLTMVDDAVRGGSDLYVLDASSFGRRRPEAMIHLPEGVRLPFRSHGEWVGADSYR